MCIYCGTKNYLQIYKHHHGAIPKDDQGRSFHIHHIDNDHNNNSPDNLKAVSLYDHYLIHLEQGDWTAACYLGSMLKISKDELSEISRKAALRRVANGTHNWLGTNEYARERELKKIKDGTHHFLGQSNPVWKQMENGTNNFINSEFQRQTQVKRLANGTHNLLGNNNPVHERIKTGVQQEHLKKARSKIKVNRLAGGELQRAMLADGTHQNLQVHTCPHCYKTGIGPAMFRYHFDKCNFIGK